MIRGDASEFRALAVKMAASSQASLPAARGVIQEGAAVVKAAWQANARATSGQHGRHYPDSITFETHIAALSVFGEIGPDSTKPQGGMGRGFEFGSRNQPPHLDGSKAVDGAEHGIEAALGAAIARVIP